MKKILSFVFAAALLVLSSCSKDALETSPTTSVSGTDLFKTSTAARTPLNGIYRSMYTPGWSTTGNTHQCFGISAYNLMADVMGDDHIMSAQGSGWFWYDCLYNVKSRYSSSTWRPYDLWNAYYTWISNANYIIAAESTMEGTPEDVNYVIGQAYAIRAYSYFMLAQTFARTYKGHESEPCAPIYTEPTIAGTPGQPRSSVQVVYDRITADINKALDLLSEAQAQEHCSHIDYYVAAGIAARIGLVMENWEYARTNARIAQKGAALTSSVTKGMNDVKQDDVLWGAEVISDQSGIYASFMMHMDNTTGYGQSACKLINKDLYNKMGLNDVRRDWWAPAEKYQQYKFQWADISTYTGDYIWMRVPEFVLTEAECECRLGNDADAQKILNDFMQTYRDPDYDCSSKTGKTLGALTSDETGSLLEEILIQRRIELWGEYGRIYDIRRLKQGFKRTTAQGWPTAALLNSLKTDNPESYDWVMTIPQTEFDGNAAMDINEDQNPVDSGI